MISKSTTEASSKDIALIVITNGRRELLQQTLASAKEKLNGKIAWRVIHDDSGDPSFYQWLLDYFPEYDIVRNMSGVHGFGSAVRSARAYARRYLNEPFIFWLEDDFLFNQPVDLDAMVTVLQENPNLYQLVLKRQAWSDAEIAAGGVIEQSPDEYWQNPKGWIEHRKFYSTNPSLSRLNSIIDDEWPKGNNSEGMFTIMLREKYPRVRFAFWGNKADEPWVTHIGTERVGSDY